MWSLFPHLESTGQRVRMTIHGARLSLSCLSTQTLHPVLSTPVAPLRTQTHTHKRGWAKAQTRKLSTVHSFSHLALPVAQTFSQLSKSLPVLLLCLLLAQRPGSFSYLHLPTGRREVQKAPWPSPPHLPSPGIFQVRAQTSALF